MLTTSLGGHGRRRTRGAGAGPPSRSPARRRSPTTATSTGSATSTTAPGSSTTARRHLWLVDVATGEARPLVSRPDGRGRPRLVAGRHADRVRREPAPGPGPHVAVRRSTPWTWRRATVTTIAGGDDAAVQHARPGPATAPRSSRSGDRFPRAGYRTGIWRFAADGSDAGAGGGTDLLAGSELKPDAAMNSDVTIGEEPRDRGLRRRARTCCSRRPSTAATSCGACRSAGGGGPERLTDGPPLPLGLGRRPPRGRARRRGRRSARPAPRFPEVVALEVPATGHGAARAAHRHSPQRRARGGARLVEPVERRWDSDGLRDPGLAAARRATGAGRWCSRSTADRTRSTAGRRSSSGRSSRAPGSPCWPPTRAARRATARRSTGRTSATGATARWRTSSPAWTRRSRTAWPTRTASASPAARTAATSRTGSSAGRDRFKAAVTCRSVVDMRMLFLTGDISGGEWAAIEFGRDAVGGPGRTSTRSRRCRWPRTCGRRC